VGDMRGRSRTISRSVVACLAILGGAGVGGLAAGFNARGGLPPQSSTTIVATIPDKAPSETVNLRFPGDWAEAAVEPVSRMLALASADGGVPLFSPVPTYAPIDAAASGLIEPTPTPTPKPAAAAAHVKVALASVSTKPAKPRSPAVLNDSQIAGIKKRLNLTPEQERYWPAVEAELRKMEYSKNSGGSRTASIDMSKVNVEGLKSAGFPLVMSFSDDQRRELKSLAHLLGLESVMAGL
jgi:hypothetical protein